MTESWYCFEQDADIVEVTKESLFNDPSFKAFFAELAGIDPEVLGDIEDIEVVDGKLRITMKANYDFRDWKHSTGMVIKK